MLGEEAAEVVVVVFRRAGLRGSSTGSRQSYRRHHQELGRPQEWDSKDQEPDSRPRQVAVHMPVAQAHRRWAAGVHLAGLDIQLHILALRAWEHHRELAPAPGRLP